MLVRYSIVTQASGSVGGLTAAKNKGGNYLRKRVKPLNPQTDAQTRARTQMAAASAYWDVITAAQRAAWNDAAKAKTVSNKLGEEVKLSGQQWFTKINTFQLLVARSIISAVPSLTTPAMIVDGGSVELNTDDGGTLTAGVDPSSGWALNNNGRLAIFISPAQPVGVTSPAGGFTFWGFLSGNTTTPPSTISMSTTDYPIPHPVVVGKVYFVRFRSSDANGNVSLDQIVRVVATA